MMQKTTLSRDDRDCQWIRKINNISLSVGQLAEPSPLQLSHSCGKEKPTIQILAEQPK